MIIYNVTVKVDLDIVEDWKDWMLKKHIPDVMKTGKFKAYKLLKIMEKDETNGITYAIQYFCDKIEDYFDYSNRFSKALQKEHNERYKNKFVAFRTIMKEIR
jgi:Domain of unknown function (DUF4286)